jgi:DNA-binding transcriptional ArsR family regulator
MMGERRGSGRLAHALGDPLRLILLRWLLDGPATVGELVGVTGTTQPNTSNHLAVLRELGFVKAERDGRLIRYGLSGPAVAQLVEAMAALSATGKRPPPSSPLAEARTCYDHLAGRLGVSLLDGLIESSALSRPNAQGVIDPGPRGKDVFGRLGVDLDEAARARRRFAFGCPDWTERRAHLGGALGAAVCRRFLEAGWVVTSRGTRAVLVSSTGRRAVRRLGLDLAAAR